MFKRKLFSLAPAAALILSLAPLGLAQDRDRDDRDRYQDRDRDSRYDVRRLDPGTVIPVRLMDPIDVERTDNRVFRAVVDQDVRGDNGRMVIPRGARAEVIVRVRPDNDLVLDLESIVVNGQRFAVKTDRQNVESNYDNSLVGGIVGAITGANGRSVRIPRDTVVTFRLQRPLDVGVVDRGVDRDGYHYHDWYHYDRRDDRR